MLEMTQLMLNGAELKKVSNDVPKNVSVDLAIEKITPRGPDAVTLDFVYTINYGPNVAKLSVSGIALCRDSPENVKKIIEHHKKKKSLPFELAGSAINMINSNVGMNSIFILRPFGLIPHFMPPPIVLPEAEPKETTKETKKSK